MRHEFEGERLTAYLTGKIDSTNAPEIEKELYALIEAHPGAAVTADAKSLAYISSAGLRALLRVHKLSGGLRVENASPEVYDVLEMTGFTEILDVHRAMREVSVDGCEVIGAGAFGTVYRLDPDTIVKVYRSTNIEDIQRSMDCAKRAFVKGIPTAISYDLVRCGDHYGVVFEMIRSDTLARTMMADPEHFAEYVRKFTALLKAVNGARFAPGELENMSDAYRRTLAPVIDRLTTGEAREMERFLEAAGERDTVVHGDIHARNVMVQDGELLLIDMDELACGHPIYDIADTWLAYTVHRSNDHSLKYMGITLEDSACFLDIFFECCFSGLADSERDRARRALCAAAQIRYAEVRLLRFGENATPEQIEGIVRDVRRDVLPWMDDIRWLMEQIDW